MMSKVIRFLEDHKISYIDTPSGIRISCFNKSGHKRGDLNPSLSIHHEEGFFHCWSCDISGSFPQLIAALGFADEIGNYTGLDPNKYRNLNIEDLKSYTNRISIPGLGEFIHKLKYDKKIYNFITSKKFPHVVNLDFDIYKEDTYENRMKIIKLLQENDKEFVVNENEFYRVEILDYLLERGLPDVFQRKLEIYLSKKNSKYFYIPIYNIFGKKRTLMGVSFYRDVNPRMYFVSGISNPLLGLDTIDKNKDIYIVEGWLDYLKLRAVGFNSIALLGNSFNSYHYSLLSSFKGKKYFIFDQDIGGFNQLKKVLNFISSSDMDWVGIFLNYHLYKDIGDIDVVRLYEELNNSDYISLPIIKIYLFLLGGIFYAKNRKEFSDLGYTFRSDDLFNELPKKFCGI